MICDDCRDNHHEGCYDYRHATDYRSCTCQHRPPLEGKWFEKPKGVLADG